MITLYQFHSPDVGCILCGPSQTNYLSVIKTADNAQWAFLKKLRNSAIFIKTPSRIGYGVQ